MYVEERFGKDVMFAFVKERLKKNILNKAPLFHQTDLQQNTNLETMCIIKLLTYSTV